ncbi:MAG: hypothetical protein MJ209_00230 [archaeon]|nr:hypothetical protein [archaeon]
MEDIRSYNVGGSDYAKHSIQPWDIWEYVADPWRADIIKRILRTKKCSLWDKLFHPDTCDSRMNDYKKIRHILLKIRDLFEKDYVFAESLKCFKEKDKMYDNIYDYCDVIASTYHLSYYETAILDRMLRYPNEDYYIETSLEYIDILMEVEEHNTPKLIKFCNKLVKLFNR